MQVQYLLDIIDSRANTTKLNKKNDLKSKKFMALNARLFGAESVDLESDVITSTSDTFSIITSGLDKFTLNGYRILTTQDVQPSITLAPVGTSPNADGMTLSGGVLNLQPASQTEPGVVNTLNQTFGGNKVMGGNLTTNGTNYCNTFTQLPGQTTLNIGNTSTTNVVLNGLTNYVSTVGDTSFLGIDNSNNIVSPLNFFVGGNQGYASCSPGTITTLSSYDASGSPLSGSVNINVYVLDYIKHVEIAQFSWTGATGSPTTLFFNAVQPLQPGARPLHNCQFPIFISNGGSIVQGIISVTTAGVISLQLLSGAAFTLPVILSTYFNMSFLGGGG